VTALAEVEPERPAALPAAEFQITYTAILVPRSSHHALTGPVADRLQGWARLLCTAWGWRPLQITVEPDYLALTLGLSPAEAPARAVHRLRRFLSHQLLDAFPDLQADIPSQGFWASAYLLSAGEPPSASRIAIFVQDTRRAQGIDV
jgi:REP element-mobilizing transposase RayT